jgi:hypothetical protein
VQRASRSMAQWWIAAVALAITGLIAPSPADAFQAPARPEPRIPGAVTRPPDGIGPGAPFDVAAFFAAPPPELNAAPLYLDAFFELDPEMAVCFPPGDEMNQRKEVAWRRNQDLQALFDAFTTDPAAVSGEAIDGLVAEMEPALRKVKIAQGRPRCVFETGMGFGNPAPHVLAARWFLRLMVLKTRRSLDRGDVDATLADIEILLRLARDLRPRGSIISQVGAILLIHDVTNSIVPALLSSPAFRDDHARRLLDLLVRHEAASVDGYQQAMRHEYLALRKSLPDVAKEPHMVGQALLGDAPRIHELYEKILKEPRKTREAVGDFLAKRDEPNEGSVFGRLLEEELKTRPAVIAEVNTRIDPYFRDILSFDRPLSQWPDQRLDPARVVDGTLYSRVLEVLMPPAKATAETQARAELAPRAAECLIALKLWKSRSKELPPDLETVVKAAGLPRVPIDPYSGQPLRMAIIDGEPVIYSIGKDGRDDGGRIDSNADRKPGDQTFRLPAVKERKP